MMRFFLMFFCLPVLIYAQKKTEKVSIINDFELAMQLQNPSSEQVDSVVRQSYRYLFHNQDTCLILAKRAVSWCEDLYDQEAIYARALLQLGDAYRIRDDFAQAIPLYERGKALYKSLDLMDKVANADTKLGATETEKGNYESALAYHLNALKIWEDLKDTAHIFKPYINISEVFYYMKQLDKAQEYNAKALAIAELKNYTGVKMVALSNQGIFYKETADKYLAQTEEGEELVEMFQDSVQLLYEKALESYEYSLQVAKDGGNKRRVVEFMGNVVDLKTSTGDFQSAVQTGFEAERLAQELGSKKLLLRNKIYLARALQKDNQAQAAIAQAQAALTLAQAAEVPLEISMAQEILAGAYQDSGQFAKALTNYKAFHTYEKETEDAERAKAITEVENKFQVTQKEKKIAEQRADILELEVSNTKIAQQRNYFIGSVLVLGLIGFFWYQINRIRKERNDKKAFAEALLFAQESERKRIARDLHDGVGQSLLLIKKQLENKSELRDTAHLVGDTLSEVRSLSRNLHPFQLEQFGLTAAINDVIQKVEQSTSLFISKEIQNIDNQLSEKVEIHVFRTMQEALNNIVKHADATAAKVSIQSIRNDIILKIQDNGKGFDYELNVVESKSLGLRTMYERIKAIGGKLKIERGQKSGMIIECSIPKTV
ncbi:MAG: tetratricopeptide repeat protein [Saprospiraceae bacterium]